MNELSKFAKDFISLSENAIFTTIARQTNSDYFG